MTFQWLWLDLVVAMAWPTVIARLSVGQLSLRGWQRRALRVRAVEKTSVVAIEWWGYCLVVTGTWLLWLSMTFHILGNFIIPTDELSIIFQVGVGVPTTNQDNMGKWWYWMDLDGIHENWIWWCVTKIRWWTIFGVYFHIHSPGILRFTRIEGFLIQCHCCKWSDENAWTFLFEGSLWKKRAGCRLSFCIWECYHIDHYVPMDFKIPKCETRRRFFGWLVATSNDQDPWNCAMGNGGNQLDFTIIGGIIGIIILLL